ncbi:hypothetical protein D9611_011571 [Ephemerocybe angulata]|uniref:BTB domain-containing protein n=1 Tax=Ephemerocybe angulata TaxID=980116 RepID=A0A8H5ET58_9AGAR|nr:hypothetical protein D9611_011571 [Tulosesus angulatus]
MLRTGMESRLNTHHPTLYFPGGDIILKFADPKQRNIGGYIYLRIHRKNLEAYPDLLKALTTSTESKQEFYDGGIPIFNPAEELEDVTRVLQFIYEGKSSLPLTDDDFDAAYTHSSLFHMSLDYNVRPLQKHLIDHIKKDWPDTLPAWDLRERIYYNRWEAAKHWAIDRHAPEPAAVILLARRYPDNKALQDILPRALYHLSRISVDTGSYPQQNADALKLEDYSPRSARLELLSYEDRFRALAGRERMLSRIAEEFQEMEVGENCTAPTNQTKCQKGMRARLAIITQNFLTAWDPLTMLKDNFSEGKTEGTPEGEEEG